MKWKKYDTKDGKNVSIDHDMFTNDDWDYLADELSHVNKMTKKLVACSKCNAKKRLSKHTQAFICSHCGKFTQAVEIKVNETTS